MCFTTCLARCIVPGAIELHHVELFVEVSLPEEATDTHTGVQAGHIERTAQIQNALPELVDTFASSQISRHFGDINSERLKVCCSIIEAWTGGTDHKVISAGCQFFCEGEANTAGGSSDECKQVCHFRGPTSGLRASYKTVGC